MLSDILPNEVAFREYQFKLALTSSFDVDDDRVKDRIKSYLAHGIGKL